MPASVGQRLTLPSLKSTKAVAPNSSQIARLSGPESMAMTLSPFRSAIWSPRWPNPPPAPGRASQSPGFVLVSAIAPYKLNPAVDL